MNRDGTARAGASALLSVCIGIGGLAGCTVTVGPPAISDISPKVGRAGDMVQIRGSGLAETVRVEVGGVRAFFSIVDDGLVVARVPSAAAGGPITVTTTAGAAVSPARFSVFAEASLWTGARPRAVAVGGPLSSVWFTDATGALGVLAANGALTSFTLPWSGGRPAGLASTSLGSVWFADSGQQAVGLLTSLGSLVSFSLPAAVQAGAGPQGVAVSGLGSLWTALSLVSQVAVRESSGQTTTVLLSIGPSSPWGVALDSLGSVWVTEFAGRRLTRLTSVGGTASFSLPWGGTPRGLALTSLGSVWFADEAGNAIGVRSPDGSFVSFAVPTALASVWGIAVDSANTVWFTEAAGNTLGRLQNGAITEFSVPTAASQPLDLALDALGSVWFAESAAGRLGRFSP